MSVNMDGERTVTLSELKTSEKLRFFWSVWWRGLVTILGSGASGFIAGFILGFILGAAGVDFETIQLVSGTAGLAFWVYFMWLWVKWLLAAPLGAFRLRLVRIEPSATGGGG